MDTTGWTTTENSWEVCLSICYYDKECQLLYRNESTCSFFHSGNVTIKKLERSTDNLVAFKLNYTSDDCPASIDSLFSGNPTEWTSDSLIYRSQISSDSTKWNVMYTVSKCPVNTTLYTRSFNGLTFNVCVGLRLFSGNGLGNYSDAQLLCRENNGYGLTGPLNLSELNIFIALVKSSVKTVVSQNRWIWIDGVDSTAGKQEYIFDDESHNGRSAGYEFYSGEPNEKSKGGLFISFHGLLGDYPAVAADQNQGGLCRVNDVPAE